MSDDDRGQKPSEDQITDLPLAPVDAEQANATKGGIIAVLIGVTAPTLSDGTSRQVSITDGTSNTSVKL